MKAVCFDFDDVLIDGNTLLKAADLFGHHFETLKTEIRFLLENHDPPRLYKTAVNFVAKGKGLPYTALERMIDTCVPMKGAEKTLRELKRRGYKVFVASTTDKGLIDRFLRKTGFSAYVDKVYGSKLGTANGLLTGLVRSDMLKTEKMSLVKKLAVHGIKRHNIVYVGDGITDIPIMKNVGTAILFCPNIATKTEAFADRELSMKEKRGELFLIEKKDLSEILPLL